MEDLEKIVNDCLEMDRKAFFKDVSVTPLPQFLDMPDIDTKANTLETNEEEIKRDFWKRSFNYQMTELGGALHNTSDFASERVN